MTRPYGISTFRTRKQWPINQTSWQYTRTRKLFVDIAISSIEKKEYEYKKLQKYQRLKEELK